MTKKVLIIEDEEALLNLYSLKFKQKGYDVLEANRGRKGIELAEKYKPDIILLDVVMPEIDGYETFKLLKENKKTEILKVIFLSNLGQADEISEGKKMGAEDYLIKSGLTPTTLVERVEKIIGGPN